MTRPTQALISKSALRHNFQVAQNLSPNAKNIAVIKANAYGHGAIEVARILEDLVPAFGVACVEEALELRQAGIKKPILLLEGIFTPDEIKLAIEYDFWLMLADMQQVNWVLTANIECAVKVWLKVDTGMHRLGLAPEQLLEAYFSLNDSDNVQSDIVLATHFSSADELDKPITKKQCELFKQLHKTLLAQLHKKTSEKIPVYTSMANSPAILAWPESHSDWNRPGFMLYGNSPLNRATAEGDLLKPVMTLKSAIISLKTVEKGESIGYGLSWTAMRQSKIATLAIGYGDGYPRLAKSGTPCLLKGIRVPLVGRVSMDMITIDVTDVDDVSLGDDVILWGQGLPVNEIADQAGTIGYELLTRMPLRVPKIIID